MGVAAGNGHRRERKSFIYCIRIRPQISMKVAVLGSTGATGIEVIRQALGRSWDILALARNPAKLGEFTHEKFPVTSDV